MLSGVLLAIVAVVVVWGILIFNRLVSDRNRVRAGWSDIDVQLQRRADLIPQLVKAVAGYAKFERATLEQVTSLRSESMGLTNVAERGAVEAALAKGVKRLLALAEAYPDLKASDNFLRLQKDLVDVEDHLQYARRYYNGAVRLLNTRIESFPDLLVARPFNFTPADFFDAEPDAESVPEVQLR